MRRSLVEYLGRINNTFPHKQLFQREIIDNLEEVPEDLGFYKNLRPHLLVGNKKDFWSLDVTGNYRIIFKFEGKQAFDLDYLDTH